MKTTEINYKYDPAARVLTVFDGERPKGFLKGDFAEQEFARLISKGTDITFTDMNSQADQLRKMNLQSLMGILAGLGIIESRQIILERFGLESMTQLSDGQIEQLIDHFGNGPKRQVGDDTRKLRSDVMSIITRIGVYQTNKDWKKVNAFLLDKKIAGALLFELDNDQLSTLARKLRSIEGKYAKKREDIMRQQLMN